MPFDLKKLQELEKAATPGPWKFYTPSELSSGFGQNPHDLGYRIARMGEVFHGTNPYVCDLVQTHHNTPPPTKENTRLLVLGRNALPELLALVAAYRDLRRAQIRLDAEEQAKGRIPGVYSNQKWDAALQERNAAARKVAELEAACDTDPF